MLTTLTSPKSIVHSVPNTANVDVDQSVQKLSSRNPTTPTRLIICQVQENLPQSRYQALLKLTNADDGSRVKTTTSFSGSCIMLDKTLKDEQGHPIIRVYPVLIENKEEAFNGGFEPLIERKTILIVNLDAILDNCTV